MIGYLKGKILIKGEDWMIVENNNLGYRLLVSSKTIAEAQKGSSGEFFVWTHLKRETIDLYGCPNKKEFDLFVVLEKMPGIGPKTALALTSAGSMKKLKFLIETKNQEFFDQIKGVGKKKMQRVLLELSGQLKKIDTGDNEDGDALNALVSLGFAKGKAKEALSKVSKDVKEPKERVKKALKLLGK